MGVVGPDGLYVRTVKELQNLELVEVFWKSTPEWVIAPYMKILRSLISVPE